MLPVTPEYDTKITYKFLKKWNLLNAEIMINTHTHKWQIKDKTWNCETEVFICK